MVMVRQLYPLSAISRQPYGWVYSLVRDGALPSHLAVLLQVFTLQNLLPLGGASHSPP